MAPQLVVAVVIARRSLMNRIQSSGADAMVASSGLTSPVATKGRLVLSMCPMHCFDSCHN